MDVKALAKSKRAHSLHNSRKHHPKPSSKSPLAVGLGDKNPTAKQVKEKPPQFHDSRPLPSNWNRYDEASVLVSGDAQSSSTQPTEFVAPKSKGADYAYLISEAEAQSQAHQSSNSSTLSDDVLYGLCQDFGPMHIARGQSIFSWVEDDIFEFESKGSSASNFEVPFLSLNLDALAEQLAKAKLSDRLFLEPGLLPEELLDNELHACSEEKHDPQPRKTVTDANSSASSIRHCDEASPDYHENFDVARHEKMVHSSDEGVKGMKQTKDEISKSKGTHRDISPQSISEKMVDFSAVKSPGFVASSAEAELDMLLSSFSETKIIESSTAPSSTGKYIASKSAEMKTGSIIEETTIAPPDIGAAIDSLLEEASQMTKTEDQPHGARPSTVELPSKNNADSKSKLSDDFDSWLDTI